MNKSSVEKRIVEEVVADYHTRREQRRSLEAQWQLNINFLMGNQYSYLAQNGEVRDDEKQYFWEEKEVFNHIAPIVEQRTAKICENTPNVTVVPASAEETDVQSAHLSKQILKSVSNRLNLNEIQKSACMWSEVCGTVFYKVLWNPTAGKVLAQNENGENINEGDVDIQVVSPFEIFPDNLSCEKIEDLNSIIYAKAVDVGDIKRAYSVDVEPERVYSFTMDSGVNNLGGLGYNAHINKVSNVEIGNSAIVIEKYTKPNKNYPNGRLTIVAGESLLFDGDLPFINGEMNERTFPFVKQISNYMPGSFFGVSVVDRLIPLQRTYNAVRNRKHEYFNRAVMNVLAVEDGSVDTDDLEIEGLSPGKVLVYRQGSKVPSIIENPKITIDFDSEEERLLNEFRSISGIDNLDTTSNLDYAGMSGVALQVLSEQSATRLVTAIDSAKMAIKNIAKSILRLYKQFAVVPRLLKISGDNGKVQLYYWDNNEICSDDVIFDTMSEKGENLAERRTLLLDLIKQGLMFDDDGKFSVSMRKKCLDLLGFGMWENVVDLHSLHINKAHQENIDATKGNELEILPIDDHKIHIDEHTAFVLGGELSNHKNAKNITEKLLNHIEEHKKELKNSKESEN